MPLTDNELQQRFCEALRTPENLPAGLLQTVRNDDGLAQQRFNIYRNNFVVLNGDALADMYPVIQQLIGEQAFRMLATRYVRECPPLERTLLLYGDRFAEFLTGIPELSALPYLPDVARLEYAWTDAYHAEDAVPLTPQQVAEIAPNEFGETYLKPHPSLHCIRSPYPLFRIWNSHQSSQPEEPIALSEGSSNVLVIRPDVEVKVREIGDGEAALLQSLIRGDQVETAVEIALEADPEFDLGRYLGQHLFDGTFTELQPTTQKYSENNDRGDNP